MAMFAIATVFTAHRPYFDRATGIFLDGVHINGYDRVSIGDGFCSLEGLHENILR